MTALMSACEKDFEGAEKANVLEVLKCYKDISKDFVNQSNINTNIQQDIICPWCGSKTSASKFCEHCGGNLN